jgi:hypothetical protein
MKIEKIILKFEWSHMAKVIFNKRSQTEGIRLPDLKIYHRVYNNQNRMVLV